MENQAADSPEGLVQSEKSCFHCGLPLQQTVKANIDNELKLFCCHGCKTACQLIYTSGASSYYQNRLCFSEAPIQEEYKDLPLDSELFINKYIEENGNESSIFLSLDNLHCPSCVWVIEKVLGEEDGIVQLKK